MNGQAGKRNHHKLALSAGLPIGIKRESRGVDNVSGVVFEDFILVAGWTYHIVINYFMGSD